MKAFPIYAICLMLAVIPLAYRVVNIYNPENDKVSTPVSIEDVHFAENGRIATATLAIFSSAECAGEVEINIDGVKRVNNRILLKKGFSMYSVDFLLKDQQSVPRESVHAEITLKINGITAETLKQEFDIEPLNVASSERFLVDR